VSTEDQARGRSIPSQIEGARKLADQEGYTIPEGYILVDDGISGTTMDRPGLRKLRELVNGRGLAAVIMYDPDRLSRNLGHQLLLAEEFEQGGVKLLIVSHPMQQGPEGWLFFQMRGAVAEYERAKILERTKRGMVARAKAGYVQGSDMPLGYRFVPAGHVHPRDCQATHSRARAGAAGQATDQPTETAGARGVERQQCALSSAE
jgi:site-specific DNA recombinase